MEAMRKSWTDERLDEGFTRVDADLRALRSETKAEFIAVRGEMSTRFDRVEGRIDELHRTIHRTMLQLGGGLIVTLALGFVSVIATHG